MSTGVSLLRTAQSLLTGRTITQAHYFKRYVYIHCKGYTSDKTTVQKSCELDQFFMNNVEKRPNCIFFILEDYHYESLNINTLFGTPISTNNIGEVYCTNATCTSNERKKAFSQ